MRFASRTCRIVKNCQHSQVIPYRKGSLNDQRIISKLTTMVAKIYSRTSGTICYTHERQPCGWELFVLIMITTSLNQTLPRPKIYHRFSTRDSTACFFSLDWTGLELVSSHNTSELIVVLLLDKIERMELFTRFYYQPYYYCSQGKENAHERWFVYSGLKKKKQIIYLHMSMHKKCIHNWSINFFHMPPDAIDFSSTQMMDFMR